MSGAHHFSGELPGVPEQDQDVNHAESVIAAFDAAAEANHRDPRRRGSLLELPMQGRLVMSGDLHDHGINLARLVKFAKLDESPNHHLILHEIVHGPRLVNGMDFSVRGLARVAALKRHYPEQVHLMLGNHELAQYRGDDILKDGQSVCAMFDDGVEFLYGDDAPAVNEAMRRLIRSMLLAVRCENGLFCSHSLPPPGRLNVFDSTVITRVPDEDELAQGGSGYLLVWGRNLNNRVAETLAADWGCEYFLVGHQPAEMGYAEQGDRILILASNHEHGMALPVDLSHEYDDLPELIESLVPLAALPPW